MNLWYGFGSFYLKLICMYFISKRIHMQIDIFFQPSILVKCLIKSTLFRDLTQIWDSEINFLQREALNHLAISTKPNQNYILLLMCTLPINKNSGTSDIKILTNSRKKNLQSKGNLISVTRLERSVLQWTFVLKAKTAQQVGQLEWVSSTLFSS